MQQRSLPLVAECLDAENSDIDLSEAVYLPDRYPHLTKFHGAILDIIFGDCPALLVPWMRKLHSYAAPQDTQGVGRTVAELALRGTNLVQGALARLFLFEILCVLQRLELKRQSVRIEEQGGRQRDPDVISHMEVKIAAEVKKYGEQILAEQDPLGCLAKVSLTSLGKHLDLLRKEIATINDSISFENIEMRRAVLDCMEQLSHDEALIVRNSSAKIFEGEEVTAEQLRIMHPFALGNQSRDVIYQKVHRLPEKIQRIKHGELAVKKQPSIAELILASERKLD